MPVNQKMDAYFSDLSGNRLSAKYLKEKTSANPIASACDYSNTPSVVLNSLGRAYKCQFGEKITWQYTVSSNNNIKLVNPYNANSKTKGQLRIYNKSNNTLAYSEDVTSGITLVDNGVDPSQPGYEKFTVTFTSGWENESYFDFNKYQIKIGAFCATDCPDVEPVSIAIGFYYFTTGGAWDSVYPCSRTDEVAINGSGTAILMYGGYTVQSTPCDPGYYLPDMQEIRYSTNGGTTWSQTGMTYTGTNSYWSNFNNVPNKGYLDPIGAGHIVFKLTHGQTYNLIFQERNIQYNYTGAYPNPLPLPNGSNSCTGAWGNMPIPSNMTFTF